MALVLIKEDGTGLPDANSYADAADADAYHEAHLYAAAWKAASAANKEMALVMATRLIDCSYQFNGFKSVDAQSLQWRPDRDTEQPPRVHWKRASSPLRNRHIHHRPAAGDRGCPAGVGNSHRGDE